MKNKYLYSLLLLALATNQVGAENGDKGQKLSLALLEYIGSLEEVDGELLGPVDLAISHPADEASEPDERCQKPTDRDKKEICKN